VLLQHGADPERSDRYGRTARDIAVEARRVAELRAPLERKEAISYGKVVRVFDAAEAMRAAGKRATRRASQVLSLGWLGIRTPRSAAMVAFYRDVLALELLSEDATSTRFRLRDGTEAHVYSVEDVEHEFFGSGPVVGFEVESFRAAQEALTKAGTEFIYAEPQRMAGKAWQHFRAPDGNVYEIIGPDDLDEVTS